MKNIFLNQFRMIYILPEGVKIEKVEKPLANLHNKMERVVHVRN